MALHHGAGVGIAAPAHAEDEDDFALLPRLQFKRHLDRCARVQPRARLAGQAHAPQRRRLRQTAVTADEFIAVAGDGADAGVGIEKADTA